MSPAWPNWSSVLLRVREKWLTGEYGRDDSEWAFYVQRDEDGMVHASPLLSGMVSTWASQLMTEG